MLVVAGEAIYGFGLVFGDSRSGGHRPSTATDTADDPSPPVAPVYCLNLESDWVKFPERIGNGLLLMPTLAHHTRHHTCR